MCAGVGTVHPISEMCPFTTNGHDIDKLLEQESSLINLRPQRPKNPRSNTKRKNKKWFSIYVRSPLCHARSILINGQKWHQGEWKGASPQLALIKNRNQWLRKRERKQQDA